MRGCVTVRANIGLMTGVFYCAAPLSGAFGGLLASGLAQINYNGYDGWPWIFFVSTVFAVSTNLGC